VWLLPPQPALSTSPAHTLSWRWGRGESRGWDKGGRRAKETKTASEQAQLHSIWLEGSLGQRLGNHTSDWISTSQFTGTSLLPSIVARWQQLVKADISITTPPKQSELRQPETSEEAEAQEEGRALRSLASRGSLRDRWRPVTW
jgi:hypothetical protein